jgi:phosphate-selective porin
MKRLPLLVAFLLAPATLRAQSLPATQPSAASSQPAAQPTAQPDGAPAVAPHEAERAPVVDRTHHEQEAEVNAGREDLDLKQEVIHRRRFTLAIGGMVQVQGAFYVGDEASISGAKDPADTEGFRIRRARFGLGGTIMRDFGYYLAVDLKDTIVAALGGDRGSEILDAKIEWTRFPWAHISAGMTKAPFSTFALQSSSRLTLIERPLMTSFLAPDRRVGLDVEGKWRFFRWAAGVYNGSEGMTSGNKLAGVAGVVRLAYSLFDRPEGFAPGPFNLTLAGAYNVDNTPSVLHHRVSGSLATSYWRLRLLGEFIWQSSTPHDAPGGTPEAGAVRRWGTAVELSGFVWRELFQLAVRYEYLKDNESLDTFGKQHLITAGANVYLYRDHIKLQVNYIHRDELAGPKVANDIGFAQLQAMF